MARWALCNNQNHRNAAARTIQLMTNSHAPMPNPHHNHVPHFLTQPVEELSAENDPESFASFQRALSKWKARCAIEDAARSASLQAGGASDESAVTETFERFA